jgi:hypothetical protein
VRTTVALIAVHAAITFAGLTWRPVMDHMRTARTPDAGPSRLVRNPAQHN